MKLLAALILAYASANDDEGRSRWECPLLAGGEGFIRPGVEQAFDAECVPAVAQQISACKGPLQQEGQKMAVSLCTSLGDAIDKSSWLPGWVKRACDPASGGEVYKERIEMCVEDVEVAVEREITAECKDVASLNPNKVCNDMFCQLWDEVFDTLNKKVGDCPPLQKCTPS